MISCDDKESCAELFVGESYFAELFLCQQYYYPLNIENAIMNDVSSPFLM